MTEFSVGDMLVNVLAALLAKLIPVDDKTLINRLLFGYWLFLLNSCMKNNTDKQLNKWARENGISPKQLFVDDLSLLQAIRIATNLLKYDARYLNLTQIKKLNDFLQIASSKDRSKITQGQCFAIMNIGTQINRKLFKKVKDHK